LKVEEIKVISTCGQTQKNGVTILDSIVNSNYGKFVHLKDIKGNKVELWESVERFNPNGWQNNQAITISHDKQNMDSASPTIDKDFLVGLRFEPLTKNNWDKFVELFGVKGACGNCWCMYYRIKKADYKEGKINDGNKNAMK
jgi:hypothetical protein